MRKLLERLGILTAVMVCLSMTTPAFADASSKDRQEAFTADEHTLFLMHFDKAEAENGFKPATAKGEAVPADSKKARLAEEGKFGQGLDTRTEYTLAYKSQGNLDYRKGTIEFWIKTDWTEKDEIWRVLFNCSAGERPAADSVKKPYNTIGITKSGYANSAGQNLVFAVTDSAGNMYRAYRFITDWPAGQWHHLRAVWDLDNPVSGKSHLELYIDGSREGNQYGITGKKIALDGTGETFTVARNYSGCTIDELRISDTPRAAEP
ncbi:MAG: hypothetical protein PHT33_12645 [bacterium]|nr:hypothetical protein [bacterium]